MAGWGNFAGGLSSGLMNAWRMNNEQERLRMQQEREQRLNEIQDMQIDAAKKKAAEEQAVNEFQTDAAKVLANLGEQQPFDVGGAKFLKRDDAEQAARMSAQANVRSMDNAMEAFAEGRTPGLQAPELRADQVAGGGMFGRQQAGDALAKKAAETPGLPAARAQEIIRSQMAQKTFDVLQRAATLPDRDEALRIIVNTVDSIPDGRRVIGKQHSDGSLEVGYVDEATGRPVGNPVRYKSPDDFMLRYTASLTPEGMAKYYEMQVKNDMLDERAQERLDGQLRRLEEQFNNRIEVERIRNEYRERARGGGASTAAPSAPVRDTEPGVFGPFKDQDAVTKFINSWAPNDSMYEPVSGPDGGPVALNPQQLRNATERNFMALLQNSPNVPPAELADVAYAMSRNELAGVPSKAGEVGAVVPAVSQDGRIVRAALGRNGKTYGMGYMSPEEAVRAEMKPEEVKAAVRTQALTAAKVFADAERNPGQRSALVARLGGEANYVRQRDEAFSAAQRARGEMSAATVPTSAGPADRKDDPPKPTPERGIFTDKHGNTQLLEPFSRGFGALNDWRKQLQAQTNSGS